MPSTPLTIWTAGYHQSKQHLPPGAVSIATSVPGHFKGRENLRHAKLLAPDRRTWVLSQEEGGDWKASYVRHLNRLLESGKLAKVVAGLKDGDCLMCWEWRARDCHRLIAANFIAKHFPHVTYAGEWWDKHAKVASNQSLLFSLL